MRQIFNIAYYEFMQILRKKILMLMVLVVPLFYCLLLGLIYCSGVLTDIPVGVVDLDRSTLSREVVTAFANSPKFVVKTQPDSYNQLRSSMEEGTVRAGIIIPEGLEADTALNRGAEILTVYDASNLIWGYNIRKNALEVVSQFNLEKAAAYLTGLGMNKDAVADTLDPVSTNFEIWYNPSLSYANFMLLGLMMMVVHQIGLLGIGISVTRDKEYNTWLQFLAAAVPSWKVFLGKTLPYFVINMTNYTLLIYLSSVLFGVKIGGGALELLVLGLIYNVIIASAGFLVSLAARDSLQVTRYLLLLSTPLFLISGYTWPSRYIPNWLNLLARCTPFPWMADSVRNVAVKNLSLGNILESLVFLTAMALAASLLACTFSKRSKPVKQEVRLRSF